MDQLLNYIGKFKLWNVDVAKASLNRAIKVIIIKPETKWANYEQVENYCKKYWRTEPTYVEKCGDDLWLGVKG